MAGKDKNSPYKQNLLQRAKEAHTVRKIVLIVILSLIFIMVVGGIIGYKYVQSSLEAVDAESTEDIVVEIPMGSSASDIADILKDNDLIKNRLIFRFYTKLKNVSDFQAGKYTLTKSLTMSEITDALNNGKGMEEAENTVTIPEGKTIEEIAEIYAEELPIEEDDFLDKVNDSDYIDSLIEKYPEILTEDILDSDIKEPLEGYLFASTYNFYEKEPSAEDVIEKMLDKSKEVFNPYLDDIEEHDLTVHEAVTIASLVENEASREEQRKEIAGVFYNRLDEGMKLETDPTVLYALGEHKDEVLEEDLEVDSPYNTYQHEALPVGPISNFSEVSLDAIVYPEETDNVYFLHDDEGGIHFSESFDEHTKKKEKYIDE